MFELIYINIDVFNYYLDGEDVTDDLLKYYSGFENKNVLDIDFGDYGDLVGVSIATVLINYEDCEIYISSDAGGVDVEI